MNRITRFKGKVTLFFYAPPFYETWRGRMWPAMQINKFTGTPIECAAYLRGVRHAQGRRLKRVPRLTADWFGSLFAGPEHFIVFPG